NLLTISHSGQALLSKPGRSRIQSKFITNAILPPHKCDFKTGLATLPKNLYTSPCKRSLNFNEIQLPFTNGALSDASTKQPNCQKSISWMNRFRNRPTSRCRKQPAEIIDSSE